MAKNLLIFKELEIYFLPSLSLSVLQSLKHYLGYLMFQTAQSPEFGLAFSQFAFVVITANWITFDGYLGESNDMEGLVQLPVAEWIGVHLVVPSA